MSMTDPAHLRAVRAARHKAHRAFDKTWMKRGWDRNVAYVWLARQLGIPVEQCHFGMFTLETLERIVRLMAAQLTPPGPVRRFGRLRGNRRGSKRRPLSRPPTPPRAIRCLEDALRLEG